jgi:hypothetical protein
MSEPEKRHDRDAELIEQLTRPVAAQDLGGAREAPSPIDNFFKPAESADEDTPFDLFGDDK